ncbi:hypothetical protein HMPREF1584_00196 [Gardnerella vaginalis JCP8481A]|nr:hypothetical protein HMPREF1585_00356 [Gardnerella vaginalis JCP8481B]EPI44673.1 hypothetical protein HMPREF1584_00196 [Gardnerella vaginalis JCP8481A]
MLHLPLSNDVSFVGFLYLRLQNFINMQTYNLCEKSQISTTRI